MDYSPILYFYWSNPAKCEYHVVRKVVGSRPDQDGLINTDHGMVPEHMLVPVCEGNIKEMKEYCVCHKRNEVMRMDQTLLQVLQRMKLRSK